MCVCRCEGAYHNYIILKVGFTAEGKILALELSMYSNAGASVDLTYGVRTFYHVCVCVSVCVLSFSLPLYLYWMLM